MMTPVLDGIIPKQNSMDFETLSATHKGAVLREHSLLASLT